VDVDGGFCWRLICCLLSRSRYYKATCCYFSVRFLDSSCIAAWLLAEQPESLPCGVFIVVVGLHWMHALAVPDEVDPRL